MMSHAQTFSFFSVSTKNVDYTELNKSFTYCKSLRYFNNFDKPFRRHLKL